jgi:hypothetical protein
MAFRLRLIAPVIAVCALLAACGGGYEGTPSPIDTSTQTLKVSSGAALSLMPTELRQLEISGGTRPYTVRSSNSAVVLASVSDGTLRLAAIKGDPIPVNVVVTDDKKAQSTVSVTVTNSPQQGTFSISPREVAVQPGATLPLALTGGSPPFSATSLSPNIAGVTVSGSTLTVTGVAEGSNAEIRVFDSRNVTQSALVTVAAPMPSASGQRLAVNWPANLALRPNNSVTYTIAGGTPPYSVKTTKSAADTTPHTSVLSGIVRNGALMLQAGMAGNALVTVTDSAGASIAQQIYVQTTSAPLALLKSAVTGIQYTTEDVVIAGGMPPYRVVTTNTNLIANGTLVDANGNVVESGDILRVSMLNVGGPTTLTVKDSEGSTASVAVTVGAVLSNMSLSPSAMTISELLRVSFPIRVIGGRAVARNYLVFSSHPNLLTPSVQANSDIITVTPVNLCVDLTTPVVITVIDETGATAAATITVQDNGPC